VRAGAAERDDVRAVIDRLRGVDVAEASTQVLEAISPVRSASPIVGLAARPVHAADALYRNPAPLVVMIVGVQDPGNLGAIVRVAEAAGAAGVVSTDGSADPFGWKALRGSMGSALRLPVVSTADSGVAIRNARRQGSRIVATMPRGGRSLYDVDLSGPLAVLIGGEGQGLSSAALTEADERVSIPMAGPVESLNAAVAAAIVLYEARRQRMP
jgi:TrmH family RNA methyltransferase